MAFKTENEYQERLDANGLYTKMPKAVLAAILVSFVDRLGYKDLDAAIKEEWAALYQANVIPQKPIK